MKNDQFAKIYQKMNNKERAISAFHHIINGNELEYKRVKHSVPWYNYNCIDSEYREWVSGINAIGTIWGLRYWKLYAGYKTAFAGMFFSLCGQENEKTLEFFDEIEPLEKIILSHEQALLEVCQMLGLEFTDICRISGAKPFDPIFSDSDSDFDLEYVERTRDMLLGCLPK